MSTADLDLPASSARHKQTPAFVHGQIYGMDILPATPRQIDFMEALGRRGRDSRNCSYGAAAKMIGSLLSERLASRD